jgi:hypothetical protein
VIQGKEHTVDQKNIFVEFLWQGKHWISKEMLYLPMHMEGQ